MATDTQKKTEPKLSCREAQLVLRVTPLRKHAKHMTKVEIEALGHYLHCPPCREQGLANLLDVKLTCQNAIFVWAENATALWQDCSPGHFIRLTSMIELYAVEHVWGRYEWKNFMGGHGWDITTACPERPCRSLHSYWASVPMSTMSGDGASGVIGLYPLLFEIFAKEGWLVDKLLTLQRKRVAKVLDDILKGEVTVSTGHYHSIQELATEIIQHFWALQMLANASKPSGPA